MDRIGYRRRDMGGWHLRLVTDAQVAADYLMRTWGGVLPASFYRWLRAGRPDTTYLLTQGVFQPERWVMPTALTVAVPVEAALPVKEFALAALDSQP